VLQTHELDRESWSNFLQIRLCTLFVKNVPMMAEEDEVALIMQRDYSSSNEFRSLGKQGS